MKSSIISIGNSKGVRIPKALLEETGLKNEVTISLERKALVIRPSKTDADEGLAVSRSALAKEWDRPEEDEAWASLQ
jgi:antitoxin MazE